ncbi:LysR family transcriptional regulator [Gluconobacter sp. Dm-62]|uniref:LysR family transcriptional regulator n=1 Tax=Gluconobacter sp. Dm-62 TaxID=2799804 RepID=UPI001B8C4F17|nr:LysR family transcriptional regulator [Gluconobacter sp. Dm-62]MBS1101447.1 LysR family transcriptional regulator [Gluconobacter sp. Dm-62]
MELPALTYFVALIDAGSPAKAAEALGVSSSTINHAVQSLEQSMEFPLLLRTPKRRHPEAIPTACGQSLYRSAVSLLRWGAEIVSFPQDAPVRSQSLLPLSDLQLLLQSGLTLRMIGYFLTVCEVGSVAKAARRLSLSQPTLSRQIQKLEKILNRELLIRSPFGVRLTPGAEALMEGCQRADQTYRSIMRDENFSYFRQFRTLRLASMMPSSSDSSLTLTLARLVRLWRERRYQPTLTVSTLAAPTMVEGLLGDTYDVGLTDLLDIPPNLDHMDLETSDLHLVFSREHVPSGATLATLIEGNTLAIPAFGTGLRRLTDQFLEHTGVAPQSLFETQSISLMLRLVIDGTCCAIMPAGSFRQQDVDSLPLPPRYRMTTRLIWKKAHSNPASIERLKACLLENRRRMGPEAGRFRKSAA